ncbi:unnamed protein product, partial [Rotaria magnacalcarata]
MRAAGAIAPSRSAADSKQIDQNLAGESGLHVKIAAKK